MDDEIADFKKQLEEMKQKSLSLAAAIPDIEEAPAAAETTEENQEPKHITDNSVWVGNLDQSVTEAKLQNYFSCCGEIVKITIPTKASRLPAKYAYIEFAKQKSVDIALKLNDNLFSGKNIQVRRKRDNIPGKGAPRRRRSFRRF